jgi:hypothetical protein
MGFSLELFFEKLEEMISNGAPHGVLEEYVQQQKQYAKECGIIRNSNND